MSTFNLSKRIMEQVKTREDEAKEDWARTKAELKNYYDVFIVEEHR